MKVVSGLDMDKLITRLNRMAKNVAYNMPEWSSKVYTEDEYKKRKFMNTIESLVMGIGPIICLIVVLYSCCG